MSEGRKAIIYPFDGSLNQLETQYPSIDTIARCAVMNEFGDVNDDVVIMWGQVKAYTDMTPYYLILGTTLVIAVSYFTITTIIKTKSTRNKRKLASLNK